MITAGDSSSDVTADEERKIERNQRMAASGEEGKAGDESDDWEDVDCDDGDMEEVEEVDSEEEGSSNKPLEESKTSEDFVIINGDSSVSGTEP